ncbi:hypothetical protein IV417_09385 [Alphaproteobacteria bacterium KMM 3653]|uniref:Uncharacterized protein n=1 Tax=Harenicola maris TaxID=2841044 RepID=A0AAP2G8K3_9RHOB|nr:hypothetical protein [Harenicola maris]
MLTFGQFKGFAIVNAALFCAAPALAQSSLPPKGCEAFLTVQQRSCTVSHFWRCEGAPEGTTWEAVYDEDGPSSVHTYDRDFQWLDGYFFDSGISERLYEPGPDPISMSELLGTGRDTYDFSMVELSEDGQQITRTKGTDEFIGRLETIDGVTLRMVYVDSETFNEEGEVIFSSHGFQYVWPEERLFFLGTDTSNNGEEAWESDSTPVDFIFPGEKNFDRLRPVYDCGELSVRLSDPQSHIHQGAFR